MAKKTKYCDIRIKIECPNCKQISEVKLYTAIIRWFNDNNSGFCSECKRYTSQIGMFKRSEKNGAKGRLICSKCGEITTCSYTYEMSIKKAIKKGEIVSFICPVCGLAERAKNPHKIKAKSIVKNSKKVKEVNLFGCRVCPAGGWDSYVSSRCQWAEECAHYDDCMSYIARNHLSWYGFSADGKGFKKKDIFNEEIFKMEKNVSEKEKKKCNCQEWAEFGSYFCPVHGHINKYRHEIEED